MKLKMIFSFVLINVCAIAGTLPPAAVLTAFNAKFPNATEVKWGMENKTDYEADFKLDEKITSANFKEDGTWVETETETDSKDLPAAVTASLQKNYPGEIIKKTEKIEKPGSTVYEVKVKGEDYLFDESGKFLGEAEEE